MNTDIILLANGIDPEKLWRRARICVAFSKAVEKVKRS